MTCPSIHFCKLLADPFATPHRRPARRPAALVAPALHLAARSSCATAVLALLLDGGVDPNIRNAKARGGRASLAWAVVCPPLRRWRAVMPAGLLCRAGLVSFRAVRAGSRATTLCSLVLPRLCGSTATLAAHSLLVVHGSTAGSECPSSAGRAPPGRLPPADSAATALLALPPLPQGQTAAQVASDPYILQILKDPESECPRVPAPDVRRPDGYTFEALRYLAARNAL